MREIYVRDSLNIREQPSPEELFPGLYSPETSDLSETKFLELRNAINEILNSNIQMSPEILIRLAKIFRKYVPQEKFDYKLTESEKRILKMLVDGQNYKTASGELDISIHTISFYLRNIYTKLQVHSKTEAVAKAVREGLV